MAAERICRGVSADQVVMGMDQSEMMSVLVGHEGRVAQPEAFTGGDTGGEEVQGRRLSVRPGIGIVARGKSGERDVSQRRREGKDEVDKLVLRSVVVNLHEVVLEEALVIERSEVQKGPAIRRAAEGRTPRMEDRIAQSPPDATSRRRVRELDGRTGNEVGEIAATGDL